jgi:hypothetical protein
MGDGERCEGVGECCTALGNALRISELARCYCVDDWCVDVSEMMG